MLDVSSLLDFLLLTLVNRLTEVPSLAFVSCTGVLPRVFYPPACQVQIFHAGDLTAIPGLHLVL